MANDLRIAVFRPNDNGHKIICAVEQLQYSVDQFEGFDISLLEKRRLCKVYGRQISFTVTGFISYKQEIVIVFPKGHRFPKQFEGLLEHVRVLAKALFRYREEANYLPEESELLNGGGTGGIFGPAPALWIMQDYLMHGYIRKDRKIYRTGPGSPVDWGRTTKRIEPYVINNRPLYLDFIIRETGNDSSHKLSLLHKYAVSESFRLYGWLLDKEVETGGDGTYNPFSAETTKVILQMELRETNVDREIKLINAIKDFLLGSDESAERKELNTFATPYFHHVWEKICGAIFENEYIQLKHLVPVPTWEWEEVKTATIQIPDILFRYEDTLYILDAKYYDTRRNLPGWHDLVKQFFYAYSLKGMESNYRNVMVFPTSTEYPDGMTYNGFSAIRGREDLGKVDGVSLNIIKAMKHYGSYSRSNFRNILAKIVCE